MIRIHIYVMEMSTHVCSYSVPNHLGPGQFIRDSEWVTKDAGLFTECESSPDRVVRVAAEV